MKAVILAGGLGTRLSEHTVVRPKPLVEIGDRPILWHIMKMYSAAGINDFIICLGYKGYLIKEFFFNYLYHTSDLQISLANGQIKIINRHPEEWNVTLVDTGAESMTGGRIRRIRDYISPGEDFCVTYGDGVSSLKIREVIDFHKQHGKAATVTAVLPPGRFGALELQDESVTSFMEKPAGDGNFINGGFFVFSPKVFDYIEGDDTVLEQQPLKGLASDGQLKAFLHRGFWQPMDTVRDKQVLEDLWNRNVAPWKMWK